MKMEPRDIIKTCSAHYYTWKEEAFRAQTKDEMKKFLDKAFFWLELQNNLLILWTIKRTLGDDPNIIKKVEKAEMHINKKITDYASQVLKDLE